MHRVLLGVLIALLAAGPHTTALAAPGKKSALSSSQAQIVVNSLTRGAKVFINDEEVGEVPLAKPIEVKPGQNYTVRVQKRGYAPFVDTVLAGAGQQSEVEADLVPTGGIVRITSNIVRAQVLLNGKAIGRTPFDGDIEPGKHQLQVASAGYLTDTRTVEVKAGEEVAVAVDLKLVPAPVELENKSLFGRWWFWTAVGAVVVGGVAGGVAATQTTRVTPSHDAVLKIP